jgi:predicted TIM-barrel fold metal-dependent hydrolase
MPYTDCHAHVFDLDLPLVGERRYTPVRSASAARYVEQLAAHGFERGVLVQPSFLGTDNRQMLAALRGFGDRLRGIAVVDPGISPDEMDLLDAGGTVGIRLNLIGREIPTLRDARWRHLFRQLATRDWNVEIHCHARELDAVLPPLVDAGVRVVVDHMGRPDPELGTEDPGFRYLLSMARTRAVWVKLSGSYRHGANGQALAANAVAPLVDAFGLRRLVWGSDWPHTMFEDSMSFGETVRRLDAWLPDASDRQIVTAEVPADLYGWSTRPPFEPSGATDD